MTLYFGNNEVSQKVLLSTVGSNLPEITTETSGKILSNNGTELEWIDNPSGKIIGSFGYTLDEVAPDGCVFCDGGEYEKVQFPDFYQSLVDNKRKSVDYATFNSSVSTNGSCGFFGLDTENEKFKVPMLKDVYLKAGQEPIIFGDESLPNIKGNTGYNWGGTWGPSGVFAAASGSDGKYGGTSGTTSRVDFDASRSSSTYQDGAKVNPDYVAYKVYVVLATKKSETSSEIKDYEIYNTVPLLTPLFHPEEISDTNWLKSDGQWNPASVYETVYDELTSDYALGTDKTDEIDGVTISYRLTPKKRRICLSDQDTNVTNLFNATGIAWYYVIDNSNNQFKLPRSKYAFVGNRDNVGGYVGESLPNIKGSISVIPAQTLSLGVVYGSGAFSKTKTAPAKGCESGGSSQPTIQPSFDASLSSSTYQDDAPVQQRSIEAYLYFKVGNATVNAQLVNVGNITNTLTTKADVGFNNITAEAKGLIAGLAMPSEKYIDLDLQASGSIYQNIYDDGYVALSRLGDGFAQISVLKDGSSFEQSNRIYTQLCTSGGLGSAQTYAAVKKGMYFYVSYAGTSTVFFRFIYAEGSKE